MAVPTVATTAVSEVTDSTAESGGTITSDGGASLTHYGVCWSARTPPTIGDYFTVDWMADITGTGALSIGDWLRQAVTSNTALNQTANDTAVFQFRVLHIHFMASPSPTHPPRTASYPTAIGE